jgi:hypothetical protein
MKSSTIKLILGTLFVGLLCFGCKSEGHRYIDEMAVTLEEGARRMTEAETPEAGSTAALEYFQENAVRMRIVQSRFDDTVRTLNRYQRADLKEYAQQRLTAVKKILEGLSTP